MANSVSAIVALASHLAILVGIILQQRAGWVAGDAIPVSQAFTTPPFVSEVWAGNLTGARGMVVDSAGDVLVVVPGLGGIYALWEQESSSSSSSSSRIEGVVMTVERALIVNNSELNHGIAIYGNHLYASSPSTVWRYEYTPGQRNLTSTPGQGEVVVRDVNMDETGVDNSSGHQTRSLAISQDRVLYVSVGSTSNVDSNPFRARIRNFNLRNIPSSSGSNNNLGGFEFVTQGPIFADGVRNEVGLAFDGRGRLWGVENGADQLRRPDLGGDIHNTNPAEELNLFTQPGAFYGYPYCWSEYILENYGKGPGTQWAWPDFENGTITDAWCQDASNVEPPALAMPAHQAPLGIVFFNGTNCGKLIRNDSTGARYSLPCDMAGDAFVSFHGSWNTDVPVGYKVSRIRFDSATGMPIARNNSAILDIFGQEDAGTACVGQAAQGLCLRPVDVKVDRKGSLLVTSDATGEIYRITVSSSNATTTQTPPTPSPTPSPPAPPPESRNAAAPGSGRSQLQALLLLVAVATSLSLLVGGPDFII